MRTRLICPHPVEAGIGRPFQMQSRQFVQYPIQDLSGIQGCLPLLQTGIHALLLREHSRVPVAVLTTRTERIFCILQYIGFAEIDGTYT